MPDLREQLQQLFQGRVCLMGLGNVDWGDDGFGLRLIEALQSVEVGEASPPGQDSSVRSGMFIVNWPSADQAPLGAACGSRRCKPIMPLLTELENSSAGSRGYKHAAPNGAATGRHGKDGLYNHGLELGAILAGTTPERHLGSVIAGNYDHLVFLDVVEFGAAPGSVVLLNSREMAARFPQVSTHKLSLGLLAKQVEANGRAKVWLLGVQPESLCLGGELTPAVRATLELLLDLIKACLTSSSRGNEALISRGRWPDERESLSLVTSAATSNSEVMA